MSSNAATLIINSPPQGQGSGSDPPHTPVCVLNDDGTATISLGDNQIASLIYAKDTDGRLIAGVELSETDEPILNIPKDVVANSSGALIPHALTKEHGLWLGARVLIPATSMEITDGVSFNVIAREWRMKWTNENGGQSLALVQQLLDKITPVLAQMPGMKSVQRVVCGACNDFKIIIAVDANQFSNWSNANFAPEKVFLDAAQKVPGITNIETQTFTIMDQAPSTDAPVAQSADSMVPVVPGVAFNVLAREWRMKWENPEALKNLQALLMQDQIIGQLQSTEGYQSVQRVVCGTCKDFKVITAIDVAHFGAWTEAKLTPEEAFIEAAAEIPGVSQVETQTYTLLKVA